ncbi:Sodium channel protein type 7 subunit alpha [Myotis brandtii]|uniref:Sodium channel protein n=1 Tax=Myotis brandtii TaxID=109478 RepID=S7P3U8_MYOBR|nr:Sodium channel protein type 7 subunit alpha [Myotis brandtii]
MASPEPKGLVPFTRESLELMEQRIAKKHNEEHEEDLKPNSDLEVGKELPFVYGNLPQGMVSEPLEDVDPYYQNKNTFMILNKKRTIFRFNATWCTLSPFNSIRRATVKILQSTFFRLLILISVLIDCIFMSLTEGPKWGRELQITLLAIYTFEILVKLIARGIWTGSFYFFGDPWNWLDFSVTLFEHITIYSPLNFTPIFRVARSLRILKIIPLNQGVKSYVGILLQCLKKLTGVIILTLFFLIIFSLIGMGFFMGNLKHKCFRWPQENETETLHNKTRNPCYSRETENFYYLEGERYALLCGNRSDASQCPEGYACIKTGMNPDNGYTNFDNFGWALLALFRLMTQDYPEALYHQILYASGKVYMIFFIIISFWFAFYMASLFLGILAMSYEEEKRTAAEKTKKIETEFQHTLLQEENEAAEAKTTQIEMKKRSPTSMITSLDMLDDATIRHKEAELFLANVHGLDVFRLFRVLRIFKLGKYWPTFEILKLTLIKSLVALKDLILLLYTFLFFSAVVGTKLFGLSYKAYVYNLDKDCQLPRWHMGDFFHSFLNVFRILCGEWVETLWDCFDTAGQFSCVPFYMMVILIGNLLGSAISGCEQQLWHQLQVRGGWHQQWVRVAAASPGRPSGAGVGEEALRGNRASSGHSHPLMVPSDQDQCRALAVGARGEEALRGNQDSSGRSHPLMVPSDRDQCRALAVGAGRASTGSSLVPLLTCSTILLRLTPAMFRKRAMVILYLFLALVISFSSCNAATHAENEEAKNLQCAMARIKKGICYVLSKILCKRLNVPKDTVDNVNDTHVKENISGHTLSELSNTEDVLKDKGKSSGTEKTTVTENESESLIPSPSASETVPIASGESDIENLDNKEIQSKSGYGSSKEKVKPSSSSECSTVDIAISEEEEMINEHEKPKHPKNSYERRSSPGQISRESKRGKIWRNIRKTCCKIVENSFFKCFIGLVTLLSTGALVSEGKSQELKLLTSIKFLRALRVLSQFERMKVVVRALMKTTLPALNVFLVCLMIWLAYSIIGVHLFAGTFYECIDPTSGERFPTYEVRNRSECESLVFNESMPWENAKLNFDNVGNGFLSLLQVATFNGWIDIMNSAVDSTGVHMQPDFEVNIYMYCYFIGFIIIGLFLPLTMLVGVILANFNKHKIKISSNIFITEKQEKQYLTLKKLMYEDSRKTIPCPGNKFRRFIFDLVTSQAFNIIIMVLICFQAITLMIQSDEQSRQMDTAVLWLQILFIILYTGECVLKLIAFRCNYFTSGWNVLDFIVVIFSITGLLLPLIGEYYLVPPSFLQLIVLSRIIHILRPGKGPKVFHDLLLPLVLFLPALLNISLLIFLVMFIYAIFGMYNFAYVKKEAGINDVSNFETFGSSMLCLFQVTIFAGWDGMLNAIFNSKWSDCDPDKINPGTQVRGDCGNPIVGIIYFVSYILIAWLIIVNMYIVLVMEFVNIASKKTAKTLSEDDFRKFFQVWRRFDPDGTQYIDSSKLSDFAAALDAPLFMAKPNKGQLVAMDLPMAVGDRIHCLDILLAFTKRVVGKDVRMEKLLSEMESGFILANPFKITYEPITTTLKRKQEAVSATIIQRAYKSYRLRQSDKKTSDIHMIDDDREVQATKEDA